MRKINRQRARRHPKTFNEFSIQKNAKTLCATGIDTTDSPHAFDIEYHIDPGNNQQCSGGIEDGRYINTCKRLKYIDNITDTNKVIAIDTLDRPFTYHKTLANKCARTAGTYAETSGVFVRYNILYVNIRLRLLARHLAFCHIRCHTIV